MTTDISDSLVPACNRRDILKAGLAGFLGTLPLSMFADSAHAAGFSLPRSSGPLRIAFTNQHTGETFAGTYRVGNKYVPDAFDNINYVLRDFRTDDIFPIDPRAIDILYMLQQKTGSRQPIEVLSGYRSPRTNAMLNRNTSGVAKNSLHLTGQAIDIRQDGFSTRRLRDLAMNLRAGGVGYYPSSNFVHVDTGRVRHW